MEGASLDPSLRKQTRVANQICIILAYAREMVFMTGKRCCIKCFNDEYLQHYISLQGNIGDCDFCGESTLKTIEPEELAELFFPVISLYTAVEEFCSSEDPNMYEALTLAEAMEEDFAVWDDSSVGEAILKEMFPDGHDPYEGELVFNSRVIREDQYRSESDEAIAEWDRFVDSFKHKNRYFVDFPFTTSEFGKLLRYRRREVLKGARYYRARKAVKNTNFLESEMGAPAPAQATAGRANPEGIPFLYLAHEKSTVVAEVRALVGEKLFIGTFESTRDLKLLDLTGPFIKSPFEHKEGLKQIIEFFDFIEHLASLLGTPYPPDSTPLEYLPTQYLCELIKISGYDGIMFRSSQDEDGINVVLFDTTAAICVEVMKVKVTKVTASFEEL